MIYISLNCSLSVHFPRADECVIWQVRFPSRNVVGVLICLHWAVQCKWIQTKRSIHAHNNIFFLFLGQQKEINTRKHIPRRFNKFSMRDFLEDWRRENYDSWINTITVYSYILHYSNTFKLYLVFNSFNKIQLKLVPNSLLVCIKSLRSLSSSILWCRLFCIFEGEINLCLFCV